MNVWLRVRVIETWYKTGRRVDAAEDGRAPDRRWVFPTRAGARAFLPAPSRYRFGRRIRVIETWCTVGRRIGAAGDGRAPDRRWVFPTRCGSAGILARTQPVKVRATGLRD
ncbi:MAG TPA: hypothetical protein PLW35_05725 [Verrucomicrobiota bacterium]|nr:hypothetical protein [Verrucomicrobiota bacterium]